MHRSCPSKYRPIAGEVLYQLFLFYGGHFFAEVDLQQKGAPARVVDVAVMGHLVPLVVGVAADGLIKLGPQEDEGVLGVVAESVELACLELVLGGPEDQLKGFGAVEGFVDELQVCGNVSLHFEHL